MQRWHEMAAWQETTDVGVDVYWTTVETKAGAEVLAQHDNKV